MRQRIESLAAMLTPLIGAGLLCASITAVPVLAAAQPKSRLQPQVTIETEAVGFRVRSQPLAIQPITLDVSRFAFTAPGRVASGRVQTVERGFTFTPSRSSKGVSIGVTARSATAARVASTDMGIAAAGYNFDLSIGYRGVSLSGGVSRVDAGLGGRSREGVDIGLGYGASNWRAGVTAMAERETAILPLRAGTTDPRYGVEARGAFALSPQISLGGSLRYRTAPQHPTPLDPNSDDRAVMLGGAVAF